MTATKYYINSTIYPSIVAIITTLIYSIIDNRNYKSEWMTSDSLIGITILTSLVYSLVLSVMCLPIFLVNIELIRRKKIWTALSWFLLPVICITVVIVHEIKFNLTYNEKFGSSFLYIVLLNLPFIVGLIWTYSSYRKSN
jgi:hypothetical protein